ncbi:MULTISPECIES: hypothetical protein [Nostocales]|uniref:Transposase n=1 Tax=Tolypothrix campylonemoides VB511288_2 TaxID=3232311 RepID=A0ABW8XP04_9CYAN
MTIKITHLSKANEGVKVFALAPNNKPRSYLHKIGIRISPAI